MADYKIWKTINLGTGITSGEDFSSSLEKGGFRTSDWARDMMKQSVFSIATQEIEVDLVVLSVAELGFKDGAQCQKVCAKAHELGLELCPPELGPQLRLQYPDQPRGESLQIAMVPICCSDGDPNLFLVEHVSDGLWLLSIYSDPDDFWGGVRRIVFCRRQVGSSG